MKVIGYILLYFTLTIGYYFLLSTVGMLFFDSNGQHYTFEQIYSDVGWFMIYIVVIHWWLVIPSLFEYYDKYLSNI